MDDETDINVDEYEGWLHARAREFAIWWNKKHAEWLEGNSPQTYPNTLTKDEWWDRFLSWVELNDV